MNNNKPAPKAPEDIIYDDVDNYNKVAFRTVAENELAKANKESDKDTVLNKEVEKYEESFRNYYYTSQVLNDPKNNQFFEEAIREVHPGVKLKAPAKNILRLVNKVFLQELAETCFEVISKTKEDSEFKDVDQEVVEDAFRLIEKRRVKHNKFAKLFSDSM